MLEQLSKYTFIVYKDIKIGELIATGNVGVYKGEYNSNNVAIKQYEFSLNNIDTVKKELDIGHNLKSDRLMKVYGYSYSKDQTCLYLVMEYINSCDLHDYIGQYYERITSDKHLYIDEYGCYLMPSETKRSIILSLLKAIRSMHRENIVHGDLKPPNLSIHREDKDIFLKIIDYGTCHKSYLIQLDYCCGTDSYVSPEMNDKHILTHKTDIYAVGVIMTEIWCGSIKYFDYKEARNYLLKQLRIIKNDDPELEKIIKKCIEINPDKRPDIYKLIKVFTKYQDNKTR
jgi:serine/threonine protein kinase